VALQKEEIPAYFHWRQLEAWRNFVAAWGYYTLRSEGLAKDEASKNLKGKKEWEIHEMLFERGINLATLPAWQRRGILIYTDEYEISGFNPILGKEMKSLRRKVTQNWEIPNFKSEEGIMLLEKLINRN
jgi:tRNA(His) 5'-end guanylyltransferase